MSNFSSKFGGMFQKKSERPRIRPVRTWIDHLFDFAMLDFVLFGIGYAIWAYPSLPATIPTKFNGAGQATSTGPAWMIFMLPAIGLVLCSGLRLIQRWPWISNTIISITEENAERQYQLINRLLGFCGTFIALLFLVIEISMVRGAGGNPSNLGMTMGLVAVFPWPLVLTWYFWQSFRAA